MKKFLFILERAWVLAAVVAIGFGIYNWFTGRIFNQNVYFPFICSMFCILIWRNIRGQRIFLESRDKTGN